MQSRPNIIYIMADDLGFGDLSCYRPSDASLAEARIPTPNLDRLAEQGIRFTDCHTPSSICSPSRYAVLTGRYCWRSRLKRGICGWFDPPLIERDRLTVAGLLRQAGYATGAFGKWHVGMDWTTDSTGRPDLNGRIGGPTERGFDTFFGTNGVNAPPCTFIEDDHVFEPLTKELPSYGDGGRDARGLKAGASYSVARHDQMIAHRAMSWVNDQVRQRPDQPFFLYWAPGAPHQPCVPLPQFRGASRAGLRGDKVVEMDAQIGEMLALLEDLGIADNTLVMFTSDNGPRPGDPLAEIAFNEDGELTPPHPVDLRQSLVDPWGTRWMHYDHASNGGWTGYKSDIWEGGHRVPFIARWPDRIPAGRSSDEIICLVDLMATTAALTGQVLPVTAGEDSINVLPALLGQAQAAPLREATVHHSHEGTFAIRQGRWKLVDGHGGGDFTPHEPFNAGHYGAYRFFDLLEDPTESVNLCWQRPEIEHRLHRLLDDYREHGRSRP